MVWPLRLLGTFDHYPGHLPGEAPVEYGDCFLHSAFRPEEALGANYKRDWAAKRLPIEIFTPGGWWCPDQRAYDSTQGYHGEGWSVTGALPLITVTPSINMVGYYHGWLTGGVLSQDLEGRTFTSRIRRPI